MPRPPLAVGLSWACRSQVFDQFGHNIEFKLRYTQANHDDSPELDGIIRNHVRIDIKYLGKEVEKPHIFLNEARLSAIAVAFADEFVEVDINPVKLGPWGVVGLDALIMYEPAASERAA